MKSSPPTAFFNFPESFQEFLPSITQIPSPSNTHNFQILNHALITIFAIPGWKIFDQGEQNKNQTEPTHLHRRIHSTRKALIQDCSNISRITIISNHKFSFPDLRKILPSSRQITQKGKKKRKKKRIKK